MDFTAIAQRILQIVRPFFEKVERHHSEQLRTFVDQVAPPPSVEQLARMLQETFFASMSSEEGRPVSIVCSFLKSHVAPHSASAAITLQTSHPFERDTLRRLSPVVFTHRTVLHVAELGGQLRIIGLLTFNRPFGRPIALTVGAHRPGVLVVSFHNRRLLRMQGDHLEWEGDQRSYTRGDALINLGDRYKKGEDDVPRADTVAALMLGAVSAIRSSGHGGSLWLLPQGTTVPESVIGELISGSGNLFEPLERLFPRHSRVMKGSSRMSAEDRVTLALDILKNEEAQAISATLAQFSAVDGAVLLSVEPRLLAYRTFIHAEPPAEYLDFRDSGLAPVRQFGGRHRSAVTFCASAPRASALVASQGGAVTLFQATGDRQVVRFPVSSVGQGFADTEF